MASNRTQIGAITFNGIERINQRTACNEGACEEIINLRREGNNLVSIGERKYLQNTDGSRIEISIPEKCRDYEIVLHQASKQKYYLVWIKDEGAKNGVYKYDISPDRDRRAKILEGFMVKGKVLSVSYLGNILVICTDEGKYYYQFNEKKQEYIESFNSRDFEQVSIECQSNQYKSSNAIETYKRDLAASEEGDVVMFASEVGRRDAEQEVKIPKQVQAWAGYLEEKMKDTKYFNGMSLYRVALRMADGSYINYSNIGYTDTDGDSMVSLGSPIKNSRICINPYWRQGDDKRKPSISGVISWITYGTHKIKVRLPKVNKLKELIKNGILQSVDVFMTRPININDYYAEMDEWERLDTLSDLIEEAEKVYTTHNGSRVCLDKGPGFSAANTHWSVHPSDVGEESEWDIRRISYALYCPPIDTKSIENQMINGNMFKVKSYGVEDLEDKVVIDIDESGYIEDEIKRKDIEALEQQKILPTPDISAEVIYKNSMLYNEQLHVWDLIFNCFNGYGWHSLDLTNRRILQGNNAATIGVTMQVEEYLSDICDNEKQITGLIYEVEGMINNKPFNIRKVVADNRMVVGRYFYKDSQENVHIMIPNFFTYPTIEAITLKVYIVVDEREYLIFTKEYNNVVEGKNINLCSKVTNKKILPTKGIMPELEYRVPNATLRATCPLLVWDSGFGQDEDLYFEIIAYGTNYQWIRPSKTSSIEMGKFWYNPIDATDEFLKKSCSIFERQDFVIDRQSVVEKHSTQSSRVYQQNAMQVSEVSNPFVMPSDRFFVFGNTDNSIRSVQAMGGLSSQQNYGTFPLYVFTRNGIYAMSVGEGNIAYKSSSLVANVSIKNSNTLSVKNGVVYVCEDGLHMINASGDVDLSAAVKGKVELWKDEDFKAKCQKDGFINKMVDTSKLSTSDFLEDIQDCQMMYDQRYNEILLVCKQKGYTYVLTGGMWTKRTDVYDKVNGYDILYKVIPVEQRQSEGLTIEDYQSVRMKKSNRDITASYLSKQVLMYDMQEQAQDPQTKKAESGSMMIITKPFKLATRQFKRIHRMIHNIQVNQGEDLYILFLTSNDGIKYIVKKRYMLVNAQKDMQDIYQSECGSDVRYGVLMIGSRKIKDVRIGATMVEFRDIASSRGIR